MDKVYCINCGEPVGYIHNTVPDPEILCFDCYELSQNGFDEDGELIEVK